MSREKQCFVFVCACHVFQPNKQINLFLYLASPLEQLETWSKQSERLNRLNIPSWNHSIAGPTQAWFLQQYLICCHIISQLCPNNISPELAILDRLQNHKPVSDNLTLIPYKPKKKPTPTTSSLFDIWAATLGYAVQRLQTKYHHNYSSPETFSGSLDNSLWGSRLCKKNI